MVNCCCLCCRALPGTVKSAFKGPLSSPHSNYFFLHVPRPKRTHFKINYPGGILTKPAEGPWRRAPSQPWLLPGLSMLAQRGFLRAGQGRCPEPRGLWWGQTGMALGWGRDPPQPHTKEGAKEHYREGRAGRGFPTRSFSQPPNPPPE